MVSWKGRVKFLFYFANWLWACFHAQAFQTFAFILLTLKNFAGTLSHFIHAWSIHKIWHFESVFIAPCRKYKHKKRAGRWIVLIGRFSKKTFKFCGRWPHCPIGRVAPKKRKQKVPPAEVNRSTTQLRSRLDISELLACNLRTYCSIVTPLRSNVLVPITKFCPSDVSCSHWQRRHGAGRQDGARDDQGARGGVGRQVKARLQSEEDQWRGSQACHGVHRQNRQKAWS